MSVGEGLAKLVSSGFISCMLACWTVVRSRGLSRSGVCRVPTLPNGLAIEDTLEGSGEPCPRGAIITIHYRGTLLDGTQFDSSYPGMPVTFPLNRLITGWQEGIPGMKAGGKRRLTIPWQMAYGEDGAPPDIPPRANLIFEIELFSFKVK